MSRWMFAPLGRMLRILGLSKSTYDAWVHRGLFLREHQDSTDSRTFTVADGLRLQVILALGRLGYGADAVRLIGRWTNWSTEMSHIVIAVGPEGEPLAIPCLGAAMLPQLTAHSAEYTVVSLDLHRTRLAQAIAPYVGEWQTRAEEPSEPEDESGTRTTVRRGKASVTVTIGDHEYKYSTEVAAMLAMRLLSAADATVEAQQETVI